MLRYYCRLTLCGTGLFILLVVVAAGNGERGIANANANMAYVNVPEPTITFDTPSPLPTLTPSSVYSRTHTPPFEINSLPTGETLIPKEKIVVHNSSLPDLDVAFISRTPAYQWDQTKKWPDPGETVTFTGHIANRGGSPVGSFTYRWFVDNVQQPQQVHSGLGSGAEDVLTFSWPWQTGVHTIKLALDPSGVISEVSESNNGIEDRTNALSLGIYVEQSVYDFFNQNVWQAGWGGNSFDDWMQRHVTMWNQMFASAIHPLTPQGVVDRVRLDKVVRVSNGGLNCSSNFPADDKTVDLIWGFISEMVGVPSSPGCPQWSPRYRDDQSTWDHDLGILHELSHARYLIDLYGMNVESHEETLTASVGATDQVLSLSDIPDVPEFQPPANLILDGELIVCTSKSGNSFTNCDRGQEGTTSRPHTVGTTVFADQIHVQDGLGHALAGGPGLPAINGAFYRDPYFSEDLMNAGSQYGEHSAKALNRIAGQRPICGNANAPCNIGEYLNDIPANNILEVRWPDGHVITDALVEVYQAKPYPIWYGKTYTNTPDLVLLTDASGRASLGAFPFGDMPPVEHTYGHSNGVLLLKIVAGAQVGVQFLEVTHFNIAYWSGHTDWAIYPITFTYSVSMPAAAPKGDFSGTPLSGTSPIEITFSPTNSGGPINRYQWDFGDGAASSLPSPSHTYTTPGVYSVSLMVSGPGGGDRVTKVNYVTVASAQAFRNYLPLIANNSRPSLGTWVRQNSGTAQGLKDLFFVDSERGWVVGDGGTILHTSDGGSNWSSQPSGIANTLEGIYCIGGSQCWAVGDGGTILKTSDGGVHWNKLVSGITSDLDNVQFADVSTGWVIGNNGTILKTVDGGSHWNLQTSGTTFWLWGIYFLNQNVGWVSGGKGSGVILRTSNGGATWTPVGTSNEIADVFFTDATRGWAVTNAASKILRSIDGGVSWTAMTPPIAVGWLTGVHFVNSQEGWVTGASGIIFHTVDGGVHWNVQASNASGTLQSVYFPVPNIGWIVGESGTILKYGE